MSIAIFALTLQSHKYLNEKTGVQKKIHDLRGQAVYVTQ